MHQHLQPGPLVAAYCRALLLLTVAMADMQLQLPLNRTTQRRSVGRASSPKGFLGWMGREQLGAGEVRARAFPAPAVDP